MAATEHLNFDEYTRRINTCTQIPVSERLVTRLEEKLCYHKHLTMGLYGDVSLTSACNEEGTIPLGATFAYCPDHVMHWKENEEYHCDFLLKKIGVEYTLGDRIRIVKLFGMEFLRRFCNMSYSGPEHMRRCASLTVSSAKSSLFCSKRPIYLAKLYVNVNPITTLGRRYVTRFGTTLTKAQVESFQLTDGYDRLELSFCSQHLSEMTEAWYSRYMSTDFLVQFVKTHADAHVLFLRRRLNHLPTELMEPVVSVELFGTQTDSLQTTAPTQSVTSKKTTKSTKRSRVGTPTTSASLNIRY